MSTAHTSSTQDQSASFAERTAARVAQENVWQEYNAEAEYNASSMLTSLEELAKLAFPMDAFNSNAYQEAIVTSLTATISPEVGVRDFWEALEKAGCKKLRIIGGHLNFFDSQEAKIDITPYTQPIIFEAHSSFYKQRLLEREQRIHEAKTQLQSLLKEIHRR